MSIDTDRHMYHTYVSTHMYCVYEKKEESTCRKLILETWANGPKFRIEVMIVIYILDPYDGLNRHGVQGMDISTTIIMYKVSYDPPNVLDIYILGILSRIAYDV